MEDVARLAGRFFVRRDPGIQYVKTTGEANAFTAAQDVLTPLKPESATDKASDIKAQADIIYEQQRLAACKANPSVDNCK